ncbi:MAG: hypothetical protein AABX33_04135 [Nanoarchaeota archaeon]
MDIKDATNIKVKNKTKVNPHALDFGRTEKAEMRIPTKLVII